MIAVETRLNETLAGLPGLNLKAQQTLGDMTRLTRDLQHSSQQIRTLARNTDGLVTAGRESALVPRTFATYGVDSRLVHPRVSA